MRITIAWTIFQKELLDTLRDKRTLFMMVGIPLLLYPVMIIVSMQAALLHHNKLEESVSKIAIQSEEPEVIAAWLDDPTQFEIVSVEDPEVALKAREIDAVVQSEGPVQSVLDAGETVTIKILFDATEFPSNEATMRVDKRLKEVFEELKAARLKTIQLDAAFVTPMKIEQDNKASQSKTAGTLLGLLIPIMLIITLALGAFYPAVDITAGEKERGTFETLLSTPTTKLELVTGKFATVCLLAIVTGILNLASMGGTMAFVLTQLSEAINIPLLEGGEFPFKAILLILLVMVPLALFISACMMSIAVFAKSFKEASNYITPFFIVLILPASVGTFPGVELTPTFYFVPIANVVLLFRDLMTDKAGFEEAIIIFLSMGVYALMALLFAAWLFQREDVVLAEDHGIPLTFKRSSIRPRDTLTPSLSLLLFAVLLIVLFYGGSLVQQKHLLIGLLITEWGLILLPVLGVIWFVKANLKSSLNLRRLHPGHLFGVLLVGAGSVILIIQVGWLHNKVLPAPPEFEEAMMGLFEGADTWQGLLFILAVVALSPAVCEEVLFRGAILSGLRNRLNPWAAIMLVGLLFGIFHISVYRIIPTGMLGVVLTYLVIRSGSLYAGILAHFMVNGTSIILTAPYTQEWVQPWLDAEKLEQSGLPLPLLSVGTILFVSGVVVTEWVTRLSRRRPVSAKF